MATATGAATALRRATQVTARSGRDGDPGVVGVGGGAWSPEPATLGVRATGDRRAPAGPQQVEAGLGAREGERSGARGAGRSGNRENLSL